MLFRTKYLRISQNSAKKQNSQQNMRETKKQISFVVNLVNQLINSCIFICNFPLFKLIHGATGVETFNKTSTQLSV